MAFKQRSFGGFISVNGVLICPVWRAWVGWLVGSSSRNVTMLLLSRSSRGVVVLFFKSSSSGVVVLFVKSSRGVVVLFLSSSKGGWCCF